MNGFLVLGRCVLFDVPLDLITHEEDATRQACRYDAQQVVDDSRAIFGSYALKVADVLNVSIVEFRDGRPVKCEIVNEFVTPEEEEQET